MSKQAHLCLPPLPPKECPTFFHVTWVPNLTPPRMLCPYPNFQPISRSTMLMSTLASQARLPAYTWMLP